MIPPEHLEIEPYPPRNVGGQQVGISSGIKIRHIPTDIIAICCAERSQFKNKAIAMHMIESALTMPGVNLI